MKRNASGSFRALATLALLLSTSAPLKAADAQQKSTPLQPISSLTEGPPELMTKYLGETAYEKVLARQLTRARVLWLNFALLQTMKIKIPLGGMTPDFEQEVLNALAYSIPRSGDEPSLFGDKTLELYADRYGGLGMNGNLGSGRAASAGKVQIKGVGITPLVGKKVSDFGHAHGGASLNESVHEAIWGEILNRELPHGANQMIAILSTGTFTEHDGWREPRALAVRIDPLRPAHFLRNESVDGDEKKTDKARVTRAVKFVTEAFAPSTVIETEPRAAALMRGIGEFIQKSAQQYGTSYAKRFFHGATSPSNFLTNAGMIDYGTQTTLPDYQPLKVLADEGPFGDITTQKNDLLKEIFGDLKVTVPKDLRAAVPTARRAGLEFGKHYSTAVQKQILLLTGVPEPLLEMNPSPRAAKKLSDLIQTVATTGLGEVFQLNQEPLRRRSRYQTNRILTQLASISAGNPNKYHAAIKTLLPDRSLRTSLISAYHNYRRSIVDQGRMEGIQPAALDTFYKYAATARNLTLPELFIGEIHWKHVEGSVNESMKSDPQNGVQEFIDKAIQNNTRNFPDIDGYQVVIRNNEDLAKGYQRRRLFDARKNIMVERISFSIRDGQAEVFGVKQPVPHFKQTALAGNFGESGEGNWRAPAEISETHVTYSIPVPNNKEINVKNLEKVEVQTLAPQKIPEFAKRMSDIQVPCQFHLLRKS